MVVANRHIRWDWKLWLDTDRAKTKTMCGSYTSTKYSGIPGITEQRRFIQHPKRGLIPGWCVECCYATHVELHSLPQFLPTNVEIHKLYRRVSEIIRDFAESASSSRGQVFVPIEFLRPSKSGPQENVLHKVQVLSYRFGKCYLCGEPGGATFDHIVPLARGGEDKVYNLALVHRECNAKKSDLPLSGLREAFPNMELPPWFEL